MWREPDVFMIGYSWGMSQPRPCPFCSSTSFLRLNNVFVEMSNTGNALSSECPRFNILVCKGCGRTDWFVQPQAAATYWMRCGGTVDTLDG